MQRVTALAREVARSAVQGHVPEDLRLDDVWSIGEASFAELTNDLGRLVPRTLVEFGSGVSSVRLALRFPDAQILSIEHAPEYWTRTQALREKHGVHHNLQVDLRPLTWQFHGGAAYQSYQAGVVPSSIDAVIVDGPPSFTRRGREACLHFVIRQLRVGGRVYLDDYERAGEQQIVRNWRRQFPQVSVVGVIPTDHHLCVLEKGAAIEGPRLDPRVIIDVARENLARSGSWARRRLTHALAPSRATG
jgi:predicted O-methyltransferase YrrM